MARCGLQLSSTAGRLGAKAHARSAYREAVGYWEQALEALTHLPTDRTMLEQAIDLRCELYPVLVPLAQIE